MATVRVFGNPITDGTRTQRALAAKNNQNADGKLNQVLQFTNQQLQKVNLVVCTTSTTFGRVYNATGETITYVTAHDWEGNVVGQYPVNIKNGQWAVFEHVGTRGPNRRGSVAAVVYNIEDYCDSMISWNNLWKRSGESTTNTAYCEMKDPGYFKDCKWEAIRAKLMASGTEYKATLGAYSTKVTIDKEGNTPLFTAQFYLEV